MAVSQKRRHEVMLIWYGAGTVEKTASISGHSTEAICRWRIADRWDDWRQNVNTIARRKMAKDIGSEKSKMVVKCKKLIDAMFEGLLDDARGKDSGSVSELAGLIKTWLLLTGEADSRGEHVVRSIDDLRQWVKSLGTEERATVAGSGAD